MPEDLPGEYGGRYKKNSHGSFRQILPEAIENKGIIKKRVNRIKEGPPGKKPDGRKKAIKHNSVK